MVTLEALAKQKSMFYVPEAYKKYSETVKADDLKGMKNLHFDMIEPPIVRRTPLPEDRQPINDDGTRRTHDDGTPVVYYRETAYIPIRIDGEDKVLCTGSIEMIKQFYGIAYDDLDDPVEDGSMLRFYQDKIDGSLTFRWIAKDAGGKKFDVPVLEADE